MNQEQQPNHPLPGEYPPLSVGPVPPRPSSWPTTIGVVMIVLSSLGILAYGCGGVVNLFMPAMMAKASKSQGQPNAVFEAQSAITQRYLPWNIANAVAMTSLSVMLLVAGAGVVRRRRKGVRMATIWAIMRIIYIIPASILGWRIMHDMFQEMAKAASDGSQQQMPAGVFSFMQAITGGGIAFGVLISAVLPAIVLIWFGRARIRKEISDWA